MTKNNKKKKKNSTENLKLYHFAVSNNQSPELT